MGKRELHLKVRVGPVGLECSSRVPGSETQMSNIAGQLWKFSEISGWFVGAWLAGFGETVLWVLPGPESSEHGQLPLTCGHVQLMN